MAYELPITISEGDFSDPESGLGTTPLAKIAVRFSEAVINTAWKMANDKTTEFGTMMDAARAELPDISDTVAGIGISPNTATTAPVIEPSITIADAPVSTTFSDFDTQYNALVTMQGGKLASFLAAYFPDDSAMYAAAEDWIQGAIANPNGAIPMAVQTQILGEDQARILDDATRATEALTAQFAARRFPLPPGALANAALQIQQKAQDEIAESSRKVAFLSVEQMKFAIEKAINARQMAMSSVLDYVKTVMSAPEVASRLVGVGYDAQSKMISAASQFYGVRAEVAKMTNQTSQFNVSQKLDADAKNQMANLQLINEKIKTMLVDAEAMAKMASAMFNNLHASAGTTLSV